ncbi:hypothetical protein WS51_18370 [Burkholderia territorii]|nr:hypothetical protein WS51_18370 [Burkholderia territorii]
MFFALSGFLVAGSLQRSKTLIYFAAMRVIRIMPALWVEVILCALILGPIFTGADLSTYFSDEKFRHYFLNLVGDMHYVLPGVFENNPTANLVNGQLWTVPWELECYIALMALALFRIHSNRILFLIAVVAINVAAFFMNFQLGRDGWVSVHGYVLVLAFLAGVALYYVRDKLPADCRLFCAAVVLMYILLWFPGCDALVAFPAAYATVYLGTLNPPKLKFLESGDYSYGIYLYAYPIQQAIAYFPGLRSWWLSTLITIPVTGAIAYVSWHYIEKHCLRLRIFATAAETKLLAIRSSIFKSISRSA